MNLQKNAAVCHDATRKEENRSLDACALAARGYCGNIFVWGFGRLLVATLEIMNH